MLADKNENAKPLEGAKTRREALGISPYPGYMLSDKLNLKLDFGHWRELLSRDIGFQS
jgi:hypothetical protein